MANATDLGYRQEAAWWLRVYKTAVDGIRAVGLPKESVGQLAITVPTLMEQALQMRKTKAGGV